MLDLLLQFAIELIRALLVDELSSRVRSGFKSFVAGRHSRQRWQDSIRDRYRKLHNLHTGDHDQP